MEDCWSATLFLQMGHALSVKPDSPLLTVAICQPSFLSLTPLTFGGSLVYNLLLSRWVRMHKNTSKPNWKGLRGYVFFFKCE